MRRAHLARFVYESNSIESVQYYTLDQLVTQSRKPKGHLKAAYEAKHLAQIQEKIGEFVLHRWHRLIIVEEIGCEDAADLPIGEWRTYPVYIGGRQGLPHHLLPLKMEEFFAEMKEDLQNTDDPIRTAAQIHITYEHIHPYCDGNGRTGRLLALYAFLFAGGPGFIFDSATKFSDYYPCFDHPDPVRAMERYLLDRIV